MKAIEPESNTSEYLRYHLNKKRGVRMEKDIDRQIQKIDLEDKNRRFESLTKLANSGNEYAKAELKRLASGKRAVFETLRGNKCDHTFILPSGGKISAERRIVVHLGIQFNKKPANGSTERLSTKSVLSAEKL